MPPLPCQPAATAAPSAVYCCRCCRWCPSIVPLRRTCRGRGRCTNFCRRLACLRQQPCPSSNVAPAGPAAAGPDARVSAGGCHALHPNHFWYVCLLQVGWPEIAIGQIEIAALFVPQPCVAGRQVCRQRRAATSSLPLLVVPRLCRRRPPPPRCPSQHDAGRHAAGDAGHCRPPSGDAGWLVCRQGLTRGAPYGGTHHSTCCSCPGSAQFPQLPQFSFNQCLHCCRPSGSCLTFRSPSAWRPRACLRETGRTRSVPRTGRACCCGEAPP